MWYVSTAHQKHGFVCGGGKGEMQVKNEKGGEVREGEEEGELDGQMWNASCMLSDMWQGFGERNKLGRGVSEEKRLQQRGRGVYKGKMGAY